MGVDVVIVVVVAAIVVICCCCWQNTACKRCLGCKTCSAQMTPGEKYSVKIPDEDIEGFKETFRMFDKVPGMGQSYEL